jgi:hypothetical protein
MSNLAQQNGNGVDYNTLMMFAAMLQANKEGADPMELITKALASQNTATLLQQPGGIFSTVGLDNNVISTHVTPRGIGASLPVFQSNLTDPRYPVFSGFSAEFGGRPNAPCDEAPSGYMKSGTLMAQFGRIAHGTPTIEADSLLDEARGVTTNLRLMGQMLGNSTIGPRMSDADVLDLVVKAEMVGVGVQFERDLAKMLWQGDPANNSAGGGHKEFPGLDLQIQTGQVDAESNVALPGVDSYIENFGYNLVGGQNRDIVEDLSYMIYYLEDLAERTGMAPAEFRLSMRSELWYDLSAAWPCRYLTNRCSNISGANVVSLNDGLQIQMRDRMRQGMFIEANGKSYPVEIDDGIFEHNNTNNANVPAGSYASSIYVLPVRARGNFSTLYWEHKDYRGVARQISPMGAGAQHLQFWTDTGRFLWSMDQQYWCFKLQAKVEPRVILRTPHLAGKLQNVLYTPKRHTRDFDPASPYWVNGGVSTRPLPAAGFAVWK